MKKRICIAVAVVLLCCWETGNTLNAYANENSFEQESLMADDVMGTENQSRMFCLECSSIMQMRQICLPDSRRNEGTREHKCGLFWQDTCTVTTYSAWGGYYCDVCGNFIPFEDSEQSDGLGRHYCLEIHSKCGAGDDGYYLICPFGG